MIDLVLVQADRPDEVDLDLVPGREPADQGCPVGADVLRDIAQFCGAYNSTAKISPISRTVDPLAMAMAEGRRQVYLHIQRRLRMTDDQILNMMEEAHD